MRSPLIISFVGEQKQGILTWASQQMCLGYEARGYKTAILDLKTPEQSLAELKKLVAVHDLHFAFGFAGIGGPIHIGEKSLWDMLRVPFIGLMADHPSHNPALHAVKSPYVTRIYWTKDFMDTQQRFMPIDYPSHLFEPDFQINYASNTGAWEDRPIHYLFLKNGANPTLIEQEWAHCEKRLQDVIWDSIRFCETRTDVLIADVVAERAGISPDEINETSTNFWSVVKIVDEYIRCRRANWMVNFLKKFPAVIIGSGWDHIDRINSKATFLPAIDANEVMQIYTQTKFLFNTNPYFNHNVHERVLLGLSSHAYVLTDQNDFIRSRLQDAPGLIGFDWDDPHKEQYITDAIINAESRGRPIYDSEKIAAGFGDGEQGLTKMIQIAEQMRRT